MNHLPIPSIGFHPPVYICKRAVKPFTLNGRLDKEFWEEAPFTDSFLDIEGAHMPAPRFQTRAKMLWDDDYIYFGAILEGNEIWANVTKRDDVIFQDNDFEIFIDPDSDTQQYYEFEMNALNTVWDLFLPKAYRDGGSALNGYDIKGLRTAVAIDGNLNVPGTENHNWSVEVVIPFSALNECLAHRSTPTDGTYYRVNFSRVQWKVDSVNGQYRKRTHPETGQPLPEDNWVWAPTGVINIHYPELWGFVFFSDGTGDDSRYVIPKEEAIKWELRKLYYAQQIHFHLFGSYTDDPVRLCGLLKEYSPCEENRSVAPLSYQIGITPHTFEIICQIPDSDDQLAVFSDGCVRKY